MGQPCGGEEASQMYIYEYYYIYMSSPARPPQIAVVIVIAPMKTSGLHPPVKTSGLHPPVKTSGVHPPVKTSGLHATVKTRASIRL